MPLTQAMMPRAVKGNSMSTTCEKQLLEALCTRSAQDLNKVFTDAGSREAVQIWHRFGRDLRAKDQVWLRRQVRSGDYSTLGLLCMIAGFQGARHVPFAEVWHQFEVILEELRATATNTPRRRLALLERESTSMLPGVEAITRADPPLEHRHD